MVPQVPGVVFTRTLAARISQSIERDSACSDISSYNGKHISRAVCASKVARPCVCIGKPDLLGLGGRCQAGPTAAWCYVQ